MKLIILNGSSCSGKSSIIKNLMQEKDNLFHLHYDSIKWHFSKYQSQKHYKDVENIVLATAKEIFSLGYDVISDSCLTREYRERLINLAKKENYEILEINLEANFDVLLKRFNKRVESALKIPEKERRISNLSEDRFKEIFDIFNKEKNQRAIVFRTDKENIEKISNRIKEVF